MDKCLILSRVKTNKEEHKTIDKRLEGMTLVTLVGVPSLIQDQ